jgi:hypothetical protein
MCVTCDISNKIVSNKIFQLNPEKKKKFKFNAQFLIYLSLL